MPEYAPAAPYGTALDLAGVPVHDMDIPGLHAYLARVIDSGEKALILNVNIHCANLAWQQPWLREFLHSAQAVFCDGDGIRWGLAFMGLKVPPKITYNQWMWQLAAEAESRNWSFYFAGGRPGVAERAAQKLIQRFPRLRITGAEHGYFEKQGPQSEAVIRRINAARPDILITGFGMPVQELWLEKHWREINAHVFLTGGAVFDYLSGDLAVAPEWMRRLHLEWFFRFIQEPGRLWKRYLLGNPVFFIRLIKEKKRGGPR